MVGPSDERVWDGIVTVNDECGECSMEISEDLDGWHTDYDCGAEWVCQNCGIRNSVEYQK